MIRIDENRVWRKCGATPPVPSKWQRLLRDAERCFADLGQPWSRSLWVVVDCDGSTPRVRLHGGEILRSTVLAQGFAAAGVQRALLVATSAGAQVDAEIEQRFAADRPDQGFFLAAYAEAVAETLRQQELAACGVSLLPHYAPGYAGWDIRDLATLVPLLQDGGAPITFAGDSVLRPLRSTIVVAGEPVAGEPLAGDANTHRYWDRFGGQACTEVCPPCSCSML